MGFDSYVIGEHEARRRADDLIHEFIKVVRSSHSTDLRERLAKLREWEPEWTPQVVREEFKECGVEPGEVVPFFTEAYLYPLLGKEDARTLLALMRPVWELIGEGELY